LWDGFGDKELSEKGLVKNDQSNVNLRGFLGFFGEKCLKWNECLPKLHRFEEKLCPIDDKDAHSNHWEISVPFSLVARSTCCIAN
jgi:hypothetical protein